MNNIGNVSLADDVEGIAVIEADDLVNVPDLVSVLV